MKDETDVEVSASGDDGQGRSEFTAAVSGLAVEAVDRLVAGTPPVRPGTKKSDRVRLLEMWKKLPPEEKVALVDDILSAGEAIARERSVEEKPRKTKKSTKNIAETQSDGMGDELVVESDNERKSRKKREKKEKKARKAAKKEKKQARKDAKKQKKS